MKREAKTNDSICAICEQTGSLVSEADRQTERQREREAKRPRSNRVAIQRRSRR
jgi:uncharacterized Zn finger protein (UPF0148 family)